MRDNIFNKNNDLVDFVFDKSVVSVFDDMVYRSVPGYAQMLELIALISKTYAQKNTNLYDLGASTGATSIALSTNTQNCKIIAIDNSIEMVKKCRDNLINITNFEVKCCDIMDICIKNASIVVLNLTLQFIKKQKKQQLINKIYQGLNTGGILLINEKVHFTNKNKQNLINDLHLNFKRANGYSELEIAKKRQLLENILITDDEKTHLNRFKIAGFTKYEKYFQCLNFMAFLAVK